MTKLHTSTYPQLTLALLPVLPPAVARLAEAGGHAQLRLAHLVLLPLARRVLAHDARVDPATSHAPISGRNSWINALETVLSLDRH